jgi:hypothetical protein
LSTGLLKALPQKELDLPVQTAQIIVRPALERFEQDRIDPQ